MRLDDHGDRITVSADPDLKHLIPTFLEHRRQEVAILQEALDRADYESMIRLGHTIKGVGGGYGFYELTEIAARIELAAYHGNSQDLQIELQSLATYLEQVEVVYK